MYYSMYNMTQGTFGTREHGLVPVPVMVDDIVPFGPCCCVLTWSGLCPLGPHSLAPAMTYFLVYDAPC